MMPDALESALASLRSALVLPDENEGDGEAWNEAVSEALERVTALRDPAAVAPLLLLLDDGYELQDICWSIMHAAERFAVAPFVDGLIGAVPRLATLSPDWARCLTSRVLNSERYRRILAQALRDASAETGAAFCTIFRRLERENPAQFRASVAWTVAAMSDGRSDTGSSRQ